MNNKSEIAHKDLREFEAAIERWFVETMHHSPVSRTVEIYNHVRASVDALKQRIESLLKEL